MEFDKQEWEQKLTNAPVPGGGFSERLAQRIEQQSRKQSHPSRRLAPWMGGLVAAALVAVLVTSQVGTIPNWFHEVRNATSPQSLTGGQATKASHLPSKPHFSDPKKNLQYLMYLAPNYYRSAKGTMVNFQKVQYEFQIRENDQPASYVRSVDSKGRVVINRFDGQFMEMEVNGKVLEDAPVGNRYDPLYPDPQTVTQLMGGMTDPAHAFTVHDATAPNDLAVSYLQDYSNWQITGTATLLGRKVITVDGKFNDYFKQKHYASTFKFWVDADTGILLKFQELAADGTVVDGHEVTALELDVPVDASLFQVPKEAQEQAKMNQELQKNEPRIDLLGGNDVPSAIQGLWNTAKQQPDKTTILNYQHVWYIFPKKGYFVDSIQVEERTGKLILAKADAEKNEFSVPVIAVNYAIDELTAD